MGTVNSAGDIIVDTVTISLSNMTMPTVSDIVITAADMPLADYVSQFGQRELAADLRLYQSAISQAISAGRQIFVRRDEHGRASAYEIKPFGKRRL